VAASYIPALNSSRVEHCLRPEGVPAMSAPTLPSPPASSPADRKKRRRPRTWKPSHRITLAGEVLAVMPTLPTTPTVARLASALRWPPEKLTPILSSLERAGLVERWSDPDRVGDARVMLSARSLARLGLALAPRGDRWNPDRPPAVVGRYSRRDGPHTGPR
jgi:hypothetical protein